MNRPTINQIRAHSLRLQIEAQRKWIAEHGGSLYGYVLRYGSVVDPNHYGNGGEEIYGADFGQLLKLETQLRMVSK